MERQRAHLNKTVIVLERKPNWTPLLQHHFLEDEVSVLLRTAVREAKNQVRHCPSALLVVAPERLDLELFQFLRETSRESTTGQIAILPREHRDLEWILREMGVTTVFLQPMQAEPLTASIRRIFTNS